MYEASNYVVGLIYTRVIQDQLSRLGELKDPSVIYVTDLVGCTYKYHLRKQFPELSISFEPLAVLGTIAHQGLGRILGEAGFEVEVEVSRWISLNNNRYLLKGRVDALHRDKKIAVEVKTSMYSTGLPREHHIRQLNLYLNLLEYDNGILLYITPDKTVEFTVKREAVNIEAEVEDLISNRHAPRYRWECKYCIYDKVCAFQQSS